MATYINPNAIKDGTISALKTDETIATKEELTQLSLKVGKLSEITPTLSSGVQIATLKKEVEGQEVETPLYAPQGGVEDGGMRKIVDITTTEGVSSLVIDKDNDGNSLALRQISVRLQTPGNVSGLGGSWYFYLLQQNGSLTTSFPITIIEGSKNFNAALDAYCDGMFANVIISNPNYSVNTVTLILSNDNPFNVFKATSFEGKMLPIGTRVVIYGK